MDCDDDDGGDDGATPAAATPAATPEGAEAGFSPPAVGGGVLYRHTPIWIIIRIVITRIIHEQIMVRLP